MEGDQPIPEIPCNSVGDLPPEMMEEILQYLPLKDILSCRLVWKDHDAIMKEVIGKKMKPILFNVKNEEFRDHLKNYPNSPVPNELHLEITFADNHEIIKEICENLKGRIKHLKIDMNKNYIKDGDSETQGMIKDRMKRRRKKFNAANARLLVHILESFGGSLETLEFGIFKPGFYQSANEFAQKSSAAGNFKFPSLQKIRIFGEPPEAKSAIENISLWNRLVFKYSEKLKSIEICLVSNIPNEINVLKDLNEVGRLTQITFLELLLLKEGGNMDVLLKYESCGGLRIEELRIARFPGGEGEERLERVLKMQSKKLKILDLVDFRPTDLEMPVMEGLTALTIIGTQGHLRLENICLEKITPNLKQLRVQLPLNILLCQTHKILKPEGEGSQQLVLWVAATMSCKTLHTLFMRGNATTLLGVGACEILARKFPCITSLTLVTPNEEFLQKLWTVWPNLLRLNLQLSEEFKDLDQSLFGITPEWKKTVDKNADQWWTLNEPPPDSQNGSICSLTKLQDLKIYREMTPVYKGFSRTQGELREIESNFSEFSYFYGLKNLKDLKAFSMNQGSSVPLEEEISVEAREFIRGELPAVRFECCETCMFPEETFG